MIRGDSMLVSLVTLVAQLLWPPASDQRPRGCPRQSADRWMLQALITMIVRRLSATRPLPCFGFLSKRTPLASHAGHGSSHRDDCPRAAQRRYEQDYS